MKNQKTQHNEYPSNIEKKTRQSILDCSRIDSQHLFDGKNVIVIVHQGEEYRLRITSNNKLILTK